MRGGKDAVRFASSSAVGNVSMGATGNLASYESAYIFHAHSTAESAGNGRSATQLSDCGPHDFSTSPHGAQQQRQPATTAEGVILLEVGKRLPTFTKAYQQARDAPKIRPSDARATTTGHVDGPWIPVPSTLHSIGIAKCSAARPAET